MFFCLFFIKLSMCYIYHNFAGGSPAFFFFGLKIKNPPQQPEGKSRQILTEKSQKFFKKLLTSKVVYDIINSGQVLFIFEYHKNTRNPVCVCTHTQGDRKDAPTSERLLRASLVCYIKCSLIIAHLNTFCKSFQMIPQYLEALLFWFKFLSVRDLNK